MKLPVMNQRDRRAVLVGLAILVPSLGWIWGVRPLRAAIADTNDRISMEREALAREQAAVLEASRNPARQKFADSAMKATASRVFTGANDVAAGASLASYLGDVAKKTHVWLANATTRAIAAPGRTGAAAAPAPDGVHSLRVELRAESDFQGILAFLDALERGEKVVTVERLDIARTLRAGDEDRETLSLSATVVGYSVVRGAGDGSGVEKARGAGDGSGAIGRSGDGRGGAKP
jgi:hypothetical protein